MGHNKVLVIGSGAREHAICWKLSQSEDVGTIYAAPGNFGTANICKAQNVSFNIDDHKEVTHWCKSHNVGLVVVGPEAPLANGLADSLSSAGIPCFGPGRDAAQIEASKQWAKNFMSRHDIPTARYQSFKDTQDAKKFIRSVDYPALVVKASGLASGKGVVVATDREEACNAVDEILGQRKFGEAGDTIVVEELLVGEEVSCLALTDGNTVLPMLPVQDYKRLVDGDEGPNTGGMGAYCPCPFVTQKLQQEISAGILRKTVEAMRDEGITFVGVLYAGLMVTEDGPKVLEFNCRFGDPETQVILPLLENDLYHVMMACCNQTLHLQQLNWKKKVYAVGTVMSSKGYPETATKGSVITGLDEVPQLVFHSGTALNDRNEIVTNGGRVLTIVAKDTQLSLAVAKARKACEMIKFHGAHFRKDIAFKGIARSLLVGPNLSYPDEVVTARGTLPPKIKPTAEKNTSLSSFGGCAALLHPKAASYKDPTLVTSTGRVGTKLKIAQECKIHANIGSDVVAMCANGILANGAEPLYFLYYFSCGQLDAAIADQIVEGVKRGCEQAGCALIEGESAEMLDIYSPGNYDLVGFAVGAVERDRLLPRIEEIVPGDAVIGVASSGLHSNGFNLVRKVMEKAGRSYFEKAHFSQEDKTFEEELLTPTKIYVRSLLPALKSGKVKGVAFIDGGGLIESISRILPSDVKVTLDAGTWEILPVFSWIAAFGGITERELLSTFNCGLGIVLIVAAHDSHFVLSSIQEERASIVGHVETCGSDGERVTVNKFVERMDGEMRKHIPQLIENSKLHKKRVAVLISGIGTNLQALIDSTLDPYSNSSSEIVLVVSNKPNIEGLRRAKTAGIPTVVIQHTNFPSRVDFDMEVHRALVGAKIDLVCLAGFMRILSPEFVSLWKGKLINIHPALLPNFKGLHCHRQALDAGVKIHGCTVHFVEAALDAGGIILQESLKVHLNDTEETLEARIKKLEHKIYPEGLELVASGVVALDEDGKIVWKMP